MFCRVKASQSEVANSLPGDDIVAHADVVMDRAFTLKARPEEVWPWFMQLGKNRAGWYLSRAVERCIPRKRRALWAVDPALQNLKVGMIIDDWGGKHDTFEVAIVKPPFTLVHTSKRGKVYLSWAIVLHDAKDDTTRVQLRLRLAPVKHRWLAKTVGEFFDLLTVAGLERGLTQRLRHKKDS